MSHLGRLIMSLNPTKVINRLESLGTETIWTVRSTNKPRRKLVYTSSVTAEVNSNSSLLFLGSISLKS